ncbi:MAG: hypothetical protein DWQ39_09075 [Bacteroidetes bacterium]|nr:MAG: hypothetical protein DWQ39_09075 [Bacteroidota bacterium]
MRRIWTRGIENARKFMIGAAIAYNLKKWMNRKANTTRILHMSIIEGQNAVRIYFFRFLKSAYTISFRIAQEG